MAQSKIDQQIETTAGTAIISLFFAVLGFFRCCWYGFSDFNNHMRNTKYWVTRTMILLISFFVGWFLLDITKASILIFIIFIIYMWILGKKYQKLCNKIEAEKETRNEYFNTRFAAIGFKDKLGMTPELINRKSIDRYFEDMYFLSNIPLEDWKKNKIKVQEIFNTRIIDVKMDLNNSSIKIAKCSKLPEPTFVGFDKKYLSKNSCEIFIGLDVYGQPTYMDLFKKPHTIIAGSTNSGKSSTSFNIYAQLRQHYCNRIILCDFKKVTFKSLVKYNNKPAIDNRADFIKMLTWAQQENKNRINLFNQFEDCENLKDYNKLVDPDKQLKNIFIFIDELAVIMRDKDAQLEDLISEIAQTGRSQGFYLLVFTQRPSVKTVPSEARSNFTSRISFIQEDEGTSKMAIGCDAAMKLPDIAGRCILKLGGEKTEVQAVYLPKEDLNKYMIESH